MKLRNQDKVIIKDKERLVKKSAFSLHEYLDSYKVENLKNKR